jgi:phosphate transport system ATP-binding protein
MVKSTRESANLLEKKAKITTKDLNLYYGSVHALKDINMQIPECAITAIIGPSGCGKSSLLRQFNRTNDLIPIARIEGEAFIDNDPIYDKSVDVVQLRKRIGMVFQKPNVFPMSVYDNVIIGPKHHGIHSRAKLMEICERSLRQAALWDEVKDLLGKSGQELSAGARQRLCIARCIATNPEVILFDESCSALDPESTMRVEELMAELAEKYTIIIVTHNMEQAVRVSDMSAFMMIDLDESLGDEGKVGRLVEYRPTFEMFSTPKDKRTEDYITGRFG